MYNDNGNDFDIHEYRRVAEETAMNPSDKWREYYESKYLNMILSGDLSSLPKERGTAAVK